MRRSIEYFNQAIDSDPAFAQAYVGLADAYATLGFFLLSSFPPKEVMPKAHAAVTRALEIDDSLAETHASLGMITMRFKWDLQRAMISFRRALELNPGCGPALQWSGECWAAMGNCEEAIDSLRRAQEFDPLSLTINAVLGGMFFFARKYELAIEQCQKTLEMDEHFWPALKFLGLSQLQKGNQKEAAAVLERGVKDSGNNPMMIAALGHAYAIAGMPTRAEELLASLKNRVPHGYVSSLCSAFIQMGLGDSDAAFSELERAFDERSGWLIFLRADPRFDILRMDPRFDLLLKRVGLLPIGTAA